jgi:hypothetical protein
VSPEDRNPNELDTLGWVCVAPQDDARDLVERLARHTWISADAAAMYSAIRAALAKNAPRDRETLTAIATREGFPDLDWEYVLQPGAAAYELDVETLVNDWEQK